MQNDVKRRKSKINRKINAIIVLLVLNLAIVGYCAYNFHEMNEEKNNINEEKDNINEGYAEKDIETINKVRDFYLFYFKADEYGIFIERDLTNCMFIVDESRELLRKYGELQLDENKKLVYNEKREIQIIQEAFELNTGFNVDIPSHMYYYLESVEIATEYGTWVKVDRGVLEYVLYLFGNVMDTIEFKNVYDTLLMLDISEFNIGKTYKADTPYYLFRDGEKSSKEYQDYYIYVIDENEWIKFSSVKEMKIEDDYISYIDSNDVLYVYCIEHNSVIYVGKVEKEEFLIWTYEPVHIYLTDSVNADSRWKKKLFVTHEMCK